MEPSKAPAGGFRPGVMLPGSGVIPGSGRLLPPPGSGLQIGPATQQAIAAAQQQSGKIFNKHGCLGWYVAGQKDQVANKF